MVPKIKVLEIASGFGVGGAEKSLVSRLNFTPAQTETLVINTLPKMQELRDQIDLPVKEISRNSYLFLLRLAHEIRLANPDFVIVRSPIDFIFVALIKIFSHSRWKFVFEAHSLRLTEGAVLERILSVPMRFLIKQADLVLAVSDSVSKGSQCRGTSKVYTHYLGSQSLRLSPIEPTLNFLFAGRLVSIKNPLLLVEVANKLKNHFRNTGAQLHIAGAGPLESKLQEYLRKYGLGDFVHFHGLQSSLDPLLRKCSYLISCSKYEGLPLTFFEAKLNGLQIITTPSARSFEILGSEDVVLTGFSRQELERAIYNAIQNGPVPLSTRNEIRRRNSWMSSEHQAKKYYELLKSNL